VGHVVLVFQLISAGVKREITSATLLGQDCTNDLRWEASGHREPRYVKGCKRKVRITQELHRLKEGFTATASLLLSQLPFSPSSLISSLLGHLEMEVKQGLQRSRNSYCCCQK